MSTTLISRDQPGPVSKTIKTLLFSGLACALTLAQPSSYAADYYWITSGNNMSAAASWSTVSNASTPAHVTNPGATSDLFFSIDSVATDQTVNVSANNLHMGSLTFRGVNTYATALTVAVNRNFFLGAGGVTMDDGAGPVTIGAGTGNLVLFFDEHQTWTQNSANDLTVEKAFSVGNSTGLDSMVLNLTGTGGGDFVFNSGMELGRTAADSGIVNQSNVGVTTNGNFAVAANASYGFYGLNSGTFNATAGTFRVGNGGNAAGTGLMYVSDGALNVGSGVSRGLDIVGSNSTDAGNLGRGVLYATGGTITTDELNVGARSGDAQLTVSGSAVISTETLEIAGTSSSAGNSTGVVNLNGGILETSSIAQGTGSGAGDKVSTFNFNGGTLRAGADSATYMEGLTSAYVNAGGANIDTNGHSITIQQDLLAPTGDGVSGITISGTGYAAPPHVAITGDGTGATAVGIVDGSGNLTGIEVTNAGVGYTNAAITLTGGDGSVTVAPVVNLAANSSGGLTKLGSGTLSLTGDSTYTGATTVSAGTLIVGVSGAGSLGATTVTVDSGATLGGSGVIGGPVLVSGILAPGNSPGTLTINNSLTLNDGAVVQMELGGAGPGLFDQVALTGALTLDGTIEVSLTGGYDPSGGESFALFTGYSGGIVDNGLAFDFSGAALDPGLAWDTTDFLTTGAIGVSVIPEPATGALIVLGLGVLGLGRRRRA